MNRPLDHLPPEEARRMLRRRLLLLGAGFGLFNGLVFSFAGPELVPAFPGPGEPVFLIFLFLALVVFTGVGTFAGDRVYRRALRIAPTRTSNTTSTRKE